MVGGGEPLVFKLNKPSRRELESSTLALGCSAEQTASQLIQGSQPEPTLLLQSSIQRGTDRTSIWRKPGVEGSSKVVKSFAQQCTPLRSLPHNPPEHLEHPGAGTETARCTSCPRGKHTGKAKLQRSRLLPWWREGQSDTEAQQEDQGPKSAVLGWGGKWVAGGLRQASSLGRGRT